jgi:hypothetical protein
MQKYSKLLNQNPCLSLKGRDSRRALHWSLSGQLLFQARERLARRGPRKNQWRSTPHWEPRKSQSLLPAGIVLPLNPTLKLTLSLALTKRAGSTSKEDRVQVNLVALLTQGKLGTFQFLKLSEKGKIRSNQETTLWIKTCLNQLARATNELSATPKHRT